MRLLSSGQIRCGIKCKRRDAAFISLIGVVVLVLNIAFVHFCFVSARNGDSALTLIDETNEEILWSSYQRKASIVVDIEETPIAASAARVRKVEESADWRPTKRKDESNFSACMIIKDDNDLLNEWLSYHYHALDMRYLLVAVDPTSATSPAPIFERWRRLTDLQIIEWSDRNFMPESFLQKGYSIHPDELNGDAKISKWHQGHEDPEKVKSDNLQIASEYR